MKIQGFCDGFWDIAMICLKTPHKSKYTELVKLSLKIQSFYQVLKSTNAEISWNNTRFGLDK